MRTTLHKTGRSIHILESTKRSEAIHRNAKSRILLFLMLMASLFCASDSFGQILSSGLKNPTTNTGIAGGVVAANAYSSNGSYAVFDTASDAARWGGFGFGVPTNATIVGIAVRIEGKGDGATDRDLDFALSWNNGTNFTTTKTMPRQFTDDGISIVGGLGDTWGRTWTGAEFSDANFSLRATVPAAATSDLNIDHIQVIVYYATTYASTFLTSNSFLTPAGVSNVTVEAWGAGGGGSSGTAAAGGGGGGAYTRGVISGLTTGNSIAVTVGSGGGVGAPTAAPGNFSRASFGATTITANGGLATASSRTGGAGGTAQVVGGAITASFAGGVGGNARASTSFSNNEQGGGGGGSALTTAAGSAGTNGIGDTNDLNPGGAGTGYGGGGAAGDGGPNAQPGYFPGGGGGGRGEGSSSSQAGANGIVILTWCPTFAVSTTSAASPICISNPTSLVTLTASPTSGLPAGTYNVTYNRSSPAANGLQATLTVSVDGTGTFTAVGLNTAGSSTITVTNIAATTNSCSTNISTGNVSNTITVNAVPTANPGNAVSVCYTSGAISVNPDSSASATNATSVLWTGGAGTWTDANSLTLAAYTPTAGEIAAGSVLVTLTANGNAPCANVSNAKTISIGIQPVVDAGADQTVCSSPPASISGSIVAGNGITSTAWTSSGSGTFANAGSLATTYTASAADKLAGSVTLTLTTNDPAGPCIAASDSLVLTYEPEATVNAGADQIVCADSSVVSLAGAIGGSATSATWSGGAGTFGNATALSTTYTPSAGEISAGGNITLTLTTDDPSGSCGPVSDAMVVTISLVPSANAGADQDYCTSVASINISGTRSGTDITSSTWTTSGTGTFGNANNLSTTYTPSAADKNLASVTLTLTTNDPAGPCVAASDAMDVTIFPAATVNAGADQTICNDSPVVTLSGILGGGATSSNWSGGSGTFGDVTALNTTYTPSAAELAAGGNVTLTLTTDDPAGPCNAISDTMVITINLAATANAGADQDYCTSTANVSISGTRSGTGVTSSSWTTSGTGTFANASNLNTTYTPSAADKNLPSVTLTLTTNDPTGPCGSASDSMVITIFPAATVNAGTDQTACSTHPISLNATIGGGATSATWSAPSGTFSDASSLTSTYTPTIASGTVTLTLTTDNPTGPCNAVSDQVVITVNPVPTTAGAVICMGQPSQPMTSATVCPAEAATNNAGPNDAGAAANVTGVGSVAWTNPTNITAPGSPYAVTGNVNLLQPSNYLRATGYGFAIPADATIRGIAVSINRQASGSGISDNEVKLVKNNVIQSQDKGAGGWPTSFAVANYGGATDLWNTTWTPADINNANFGAVVAVSGGFSNRTATVDYIRITVTYSLAGTINWFTADSGGTAIGSGSSFDPVGVLNSGIADNNAVGTYTFYAECSSVPGCRTATSYVINPLPAVSFTTDALTPMAALYCNDAVVNLIGTPAGGTFSGPGVTNTGSGTATFNAASAGVGGPHAIVYSYTDGNTCTNTSTQTTSVNANVTYYADLDADGFGDPANSLVSCTGPQGIFTLTDNSDCDDALVLYQDNDGDGFGSSIKVPCIGVTNSDDCNDAVTYYTDADGDGFGVLPKLACGTVTDNTDCDDAVIYYTDADADGFGTLPMLACGTVTNNTDCNDAATYYTDADGDGFGVLPKLACGTVTDNTDCNDAVIYYTDADGDGFGVMPMLACGTVTDNTDCNDGELLYVDADGDGFGSDTFAACVGVSNSDDCNDALLTYLDADGDTFGSMTPAPCGVTNTADCDDSNAAVNPAHAEVGYNLIDDDCDGLIDEGFPPKNTTLTATMCGITLATIDTQLYADLVPGAQGYRWRMTTMSGPTIGQVQILDTPLRAMRLVQLANYRFNTQYKIELAVYYAGYLQPYLASSCTVTTPDTTTKLTVCGQAITAMTNVIYANNVPYATGYRFRITDPLNGANTQTIDRSLREFRMNLITAFVVQYGKTYNVEVAIRNTDGSYLSYGQVCQVTTPTFPTTSLEDALCEDYEVPNNNTQIFAYSVPGAIAYVFKLTGPGLPVGGLTVSKPLRAFRLSDFPGLIAAATYNVQVRVIFNINDPDGPYGKTCTIVAPALSRMMKQPFTAVAYPNPFADNFSIDVKTSVDEKISFKVYDMTGRLLEGREVSVSDVKSLQIGDSYPAGVYNVIVSQGEEVKTLRVIKR